MFDTRWPGFCQSFGYIFFGGLMAFDTDIEIAMPLLKDELMISPSVKKGFHFESHSKYVSVFSKGFAKASSIETFSLG